jgi:hypothetical protein
MPAKSKGNSHIRSVPNQQPAVVESSVTRFVRPIVEPLSDEERLHLIAITAYYLAESRGFQPGHEEEDWLAAEMQVGSLGALVS